MSVPDFTWHNEAWPRPNGATATFRITETHAWRKTIDAKGGVTYHRTHLSNTPDDWEPWNDDLLIDESCWEVIS